MVTAASCDHHGKVTLAANVLDDKPAFIVRDHDAMNADVTRVAIVTGGASGIGRATVELFASLGHGVVAVDLSLDRFDWLPAGGRVVAMAGDVTSEETNAEAATLALDISAASTLRCSMQACRQAGRLRHSTWPYSTE